MLTSDRQENRWRKLRGLALLLFPPASLRSSMIPGLTMASGFVVWLEAIISDWTARSRPSGGFFRGGVEWYLYFAFQTIERHAHFRVRLKNLAFHSRSGGSKASELFVKISHRLSADLNDIPLVKLALGLVWRDTSAEWEIGKKRDENKKEKNNRKRPDSPSSICWPEILTHVSSSSFNGTDKLLVYLCRQS